MADTGFVGVILCGGSGSRLWPLSRQLLPKQFIRLTGQRSLLQQTLLRARRLTDAQPCLLVCNDAHRFIVSEQIGELAAEGLLGADDVRLILEPCQRNTAPAIAAAARHLLRDGDDPVLLVMPSDHVLDCDDGVRAAFARAYDAAAAGALVTFGIAPTAPLSGYGYIQAGEPVMLGERQVARRVARFIEKPPPDQARALLGEGGCFWNSGMFAFRASVLLEEMRHLAPDLLAQVEAAVRAGSAEPHALRLDAAAFTACREDSLDYAVMERTERAVVIPLCANWSDVGAWDAVWGVAQKSEDGNSVSGDVLLEDSHNCLVYATNRLVASVGLEDTVIVETADAVLVARKDRAQDVKQLVKVFERQHRCELEHHREVHRPWGSFDCIGKGPRYQIKRITVKPGARLSSQLHHHRAEHWIVVSGTARIRCGDKEFLLTENQSTYIPLGEVHSLENPGKIPLEVIEVQSGAYLGEDDIVRFDDAYGRA